MNYNLRHKRKYIELDTIIEGNLSNSSDSDYESEGESITTSDEDILPEEEVMIEKELNDIINDKNDSELKYINKNVNDYDINIKKEDEDIFNIISSRILSEAQRIIEEQDSIDGSSDECDEYDKTFINILNKDNQLDQNDINIHYFKNLQIDDKQKYINTLNTISKIDNKDIPIKFQILNSGMDIDTKNIALNNLEKLSTVDSSSGEYSKLSNWMDGLLKIPFNTYLNLDIEKDSSKFLKTANETLTNAIYGHEEAKTHILQIFSKWIKNPKSPGNILALQGPMGNGKTTLVKKGISNAINRPFAFIALGGSSDVSYFNGHGYTYEGSIWGRVVDILMKSKCMNPVIFFDELDKISNTSKGDEIVHFLTHITDSSQNSVYQDNYFSGIKIDLSKILFIFSFNNEYKLDPILKDRMQVIRTKGFNNKDKIIISKNYLIPELYSNYNFTEKDLIIPENIITKIIEDYTNKEEGVRNLKRCLDNIISKINLYSMVYNEKTKKSDLNLSYYLKNYSKPYTLKIEDLPILLTKLEDILDNPPEHMYV
tara:strand:- start:2777 stop:4402 length:1626 start_codon:yes stop_codon:yes gene_type:complete